MEEAESITQRRLAIWEHYHEAFEDMEISGLLRRPVIPVTCSHNAHMYYLLLSNLDKRTTFINDLKVKGINSVFHYVPLHSAPAGMKFGRANGDLSITSLFSERLVRLPLWIGLDPHIDRVINYSERKPE